jgi:hypothetical protein
MNVVFLAACNKGTDPSHTVLASKTMQAQLVLLGLTAYAVMGWYQGMPEDSFMVVYRTDHELQQVKRLAAAHKQEAILVLENIRVLPEGTIAQGGLEFYTRPSDGYYHGEHVEQLIEFHLSRPPGDCTQLPAEYGGLYITIERSSP